MTVEEIYKNFFDSFPKHGVYLAEDWKEKIKELAIDFAKWHVFEALDSVCDNAFLSIADYSNDDLKIVGNLGQEVPTEFDKEYICLNTNSVIESYPLKDIK